MEREIADIDQPVIVCGWGRVGRAIAKDVADAGASPVVVDRDAARLRHAGTRLSPVTRPTTTCCAVPDSTGRGPW